MSLDEMKSGQRCRITAINAKEKLFKKLLDIGFIVGSIVEVVRTAPLLDPIELKIHNYLVALRNSGARLIEVEKIDE